ncbi:MAG: CCA tRNA nucleotidyltransferase, partial [Candidatus Rokuibacteriota bacterium]
PVLRILRRAGGLADDRGWPLALGGGLVRDLLLIDAPAAKADVDLVVEGDARELARRLSEDLVGGVRARPREHPTFLTATVDLPSGARVDVTTARRERYRVPGALPEVEPASIERDLWRRDFSVNAIAARLNSGAWGQVLDPTGGLDDLRQRRIRVLHPLSFLEDPTRLFRAVRFAARLGGRLEPTTRHLFTEAVRLPVYSALSGDRLRAELTLARREDGPSAVLARLGRAGAFRLLLPEYRFGARVGELLERVARAERALPLTGETREGLYILALTAHLASEEVAAWADRLGLPPPARQAIERARRDADEILTRLDNVDGPATAYRSLTRVSEISAAWARARARRRRTRAYIDAHFREWKAMRPLLTGEDLKAQGIAPGPAMGRLLEKLRVAQVTGDIRDRREAIVWAREAVGPRGRASHGFPRSRIRPRSRGG